jgi:flavin reductase (DIM6/NTAB) family NADH-FMN oxidoreductase RutF
MKGPGVEPLELRRALGTFATGVTVVTSMDGEGVPRGFTANSFASVSLDPPLLLVCLAKTAASCPVFLAADSYAVNILSEDQKGVSATFSSPVADRFSRVDWSRGDTGSPIFAGAAAWFDCRMHEVVDAGDHFILIGRIVAFDYAASSPLGYCRGAYVSFGLAREAVRAAEDQSITRLLALIEHQGAILLEAEPGGALCLPGASRMGNADDPGSLLNKVKTAGVDAQLSFLFAVYEDAETGVHNIVYRGEARAANAHARGLLVSFEDIPRAAIGDPAVRALIERYVRERADDSFGVYVGDTTTGEVRPLAPGD